MTTTKKMACTTYPIAVYFLTEKIPHSSENINVRLMDVDPGTEVAQRLKVEERFLFIPLFNALQPQLLDPF